MDFEKEGVDAVMTHLANARKLARGACFHARYLMAKGDRAGAALDFESATTLARHAGSQTLIGALVEVAIEKRVTDSVASRMTDARRAPPHLPA